MFFYKCIFSYSTLQTSFFSVICITATLGQRHLVSILSSTLYSLLSVLGRGLFLMNFQNRRESSGTCISVTAWPLLRAEALLGAFSYALDELHTVRRLYHLKCMWLSRWICFSGFYFFGWNCLYEGLFKNRTKCYYIAMA